MSEQFDSSRPIYAQLVERLKARILAGTYQPGGHLDSVRDLAAAAGVNPNTMQRALAQLEAEGGPHRADERPVCNGGYRFDRTTAGVCGPEHRSRFFGTNAQHRLYAPAGGRAAAQLERNGGKTA